MVQTSTERTRLLAAQEQTSHALDAAIGRFLEVVGYANAGDLDHSMPSLGTTLDPVSQGYNQMIANLSRLLEDVGQATGRVAWAATQTRSETLQLAQGTQDQAQQVADISTAIEEMAISVTQVAENATLARDVSTQATEKAGNGRELVEEALQGMLRVRTMALENVKKIKKLGESSQEIGEIMQVISDIATQTNMLALNASIEAARAGEHGRGFAVVAQEIRSLATRSADAAKQVGVRIRSIQSETGEVGASIEHSTQQVVRQVELASRVGEALTGIDGVTHTIDQLVTGISQAAAQQSRAATSISTSMGEISTITQQASRGIREMSQAMSELAALSEQLQERLAVFTLASRSPNRLIALPEGV